ncbi:MAG: tetratricopeptide repeat protein [Pseudomonadota bacterium]|nr:tetratricopeptide repeat protein [Pseudomonadota bacterium]
MAVYDLEEQEQLDDLKAWWRRWGNLITAVIVAASLALVGVQGWRWWKHRQSDEASTLYSAAMVGLRSDDLAKTRDAVTQLTQRYGSTTYASSGASLLARMLFDKGDKDAALAQLQWVVDHGEPEQRQIARYRVAEVQLDRKQYDEALRTLDAKIDPAFEGVYADLRGDILAAAGRNDEARTAYQIALGKLDTKSAYKNYVQVKLDSLGGPATPAQTFGSEAAPAKAGASPGTQASAQPTPSVPAAAPPSPPAPAK